MVGIAKLRLLILPRAKPKYERMGIQFLVEVDLGWGHQGRTAAENYLGAAFQKFIVADQLTSALRFKNCILTQPNIRR